MEENVNILILKNYVISSTYRQKVVETLKKKEMMIPTKLAKASDIHTAHISNVLRDLKNKDIVECLNEEVCRGRLYRLTDTGLKVYDAMHKI